MQPHEMNGTDVLSLSMFWAGALMVFTPLLAAAAVLGVWWRGRKRQSRAAPADPAARGVQQVPR